MKKTFEQELNYFRSYKEENKFVAVWSVFDEGIEFDKPHGVKTPMVIRNKCDFWGYDTTAVCTGKTWGDIYQACDAVIRNAVDSEGKLDFHIYIENLNVQDDGTWLLTTGS
jgi:hypothetical protein